MCSTANGDICLHGHQLISDNYRIIFHFNQKLHQPNPAQPNVKSILAKPKFISAKRKCTAGQQETAV
jgi:hypothetical protein